MTFFVGVSGVPDAKLAEAVNEGVLPTDGVGL